MTTMLRNINKKERKTVSQQVYTLGQAVGLVRERYQVNADAAWQLIKRLAEYNKMSVEIIADELANDGIAKFETIKEMTLEERLTDFVDWLAVARGIYLTDATGGSKQRLHYLIEEYVNS